MLLLEAAATAAAVGGGIWTYHHGRYTYLKASLIDQCTSLNGSISLGRVSDVLRRWSRGPFGISATWRESLYRTLADLAAVRATRAIIAGRITADEEADGEGCDSGFGPDVSGNVGEPIKQVGAGEDSKKPVKVRRGGRKRAVVTVYNEVVAEIGLRADRPGQRDVVMDVAVKILKKMNVRKSDRPDLLAAVVGMYFTPRDTQLLVAAMSKNSWHARLRAEITEAR